MPMPVEVLPSEPVLCWIVPPLPAVPVPVTCRPPLDPVVSRMMPVAELFGPERDELLWNVRSAAPMFVVVTFRAVPPVVVSVLTTGVTPPHGFTAQTTTVPPPVARK